MANQCEGHDMLGDLLYCNGECQGEVMNYPTETAHDPKNRKAVLRSMADQVKAVNTANGWFDSDRSFGEGLALIHSEVSEWLEALRTWGTKDATEQVTTPCLDPQCGDSTWDHDCGLTTKPGKPEGAGSEAADVLIRLLDECDRQGIDLAAEYERKIAFNMTRSYRHGNRNL